MYRIYNSSLLPCIRSLSSSASRSIRNTGSTPIGDQTNYVMPDQLFSSLEIEYRGHDKAVLNSYTGFLENVCQYLNISRGKTEVLPYVRWVQPTLRSKFVHKKYKLHYETRTHITRFEVLNLTGSTASTFLEYIQRNIPEGVGMTVGYVEHKNIPDTIKL